MANIQVAPDTNTILKQYAQEKGCTTDEAADRLITTAIGRLTAVRKYSKKIAKVAKPKKAKAPKAAKKARKAKAAKPAEAQAATA
jgi:hypothetical protein